MKKLLFLTVLITSLISCSGKKQMESALHSGNYDNAIAIALKKLNHNKDKKSKQALIVMFKNAYEKAIADDIRAIEHLKKDRNNNLDAKIFELYKKLDARQEAIKPILPLKIDDEIIDIKFDDYYDDIIEYRTKTAALYYNDALELLNSNNKNNIRKSYSVLQKVETILPNYLDTQALINKAHFKGTNHVLVGITNQTEQIIPSLLEQELLDFETYGLNNFWTKYHAVQNNAIDYDYSIRLQFNKIIVSPERIETNSIKRKKTIKDGWKYEKDENDNVKKDSLGNDIKIDKLITVKSTIREIVQSKNVDIFGEVVFYDINSKNILEHFPIESGFEFENMYITYKGDKRALTNEDVEIFKNNRRQHFPSNEDMVYDVGEDLKKQLKHIISSYKF